MIAAAIKPLRFSIPRTAESIIKPKTSPTEINWSEVGSIVYDTVPTKEDDEAFPR
jgi:hypothetical protein